MNEINTRQNEPPLILNPKEFLSQPFTRLEVRTIQSTPDIEFLKWLTTLEAETGLVFQTPKWYLIKASTMGVPSYAMPHNSDTLMHSHPTIPGIDPKANGIPSLGDFVNSSPTAKNFIASIFGITQYWYVTDPLKRKNIERELIRGHRLENPQNTQPYLEFLEKNDAKFKIIPWKELEGQKLKELIEI